MRKTPPAALGLLLLSVTVATGGRTDCDAVRCALQGAIDLQCPCDQATNHASHLRCVIEAARRLARDALVPRACQGDVVRSGARSTCGRPGAVVCEHGERCRISGSAELCVARGGTISDRTSCRAGCPSRTACGPALSCDPASEICVGREPVGPAIVYSCEPIPSGCEPDRSCACARATLCAPPFDTCFDRAPGAITCECLMCQ